MCPISPIVPALGMMQRRLLFGAGRCAIQAVHLLGGLIAMGLGLGHALARRIGSQPAAASPPAPQGA